VSGPVDLSRAEIVSWGRNEHGWYALVFAEGRGDGAFRAYFSPEVARVLVTAVADRCVHLEQRQAHHERVTPAGTA